MPSQWATAAAKLEGFFMDPIAVTISKPLYGNYCFIRDKYINDAIRYHTKLLITVPKGSALVDPLWWKTTGKRMEKIFKMPDNPMILYGNTVPLEQPKGVIVKPEEPKSIQQSLL